MQGSNGQTQNELNVLTNNWLLFSDAPNSRIIILQLKHIKLIEKRSAAVSQLNTIDEMAERQAEVHQTMWNMMGQFPEKTPLKRKDQQGNLKKMDTELRI
jgi:hypothetical protein